MSVEPFQIYQVAGFGSGTLGLCKQPETDADFTMIAEWNPHVVVTLTAEDEFPNMAISLPQQFLQTPYDWLHMPITDFSIPDSESHGLWAETLAQLHKVLNKSGRILIHCKGGNGRSGMLLLKLLCLQGEDGDTALQRIRAVRGGAIETDGQLKWATIPL